MVRTSSCLRYSWGQRHESWLLAPIWRSATTRNVN